MAALHSEAPCQFTLTVYPQTIILSSTRKPLKSTEKVGEILGTVFIFFFKLEILAGNKDMGTELGKSLRHS